MFPCTKLLLLVFVVVQFFDGAVAVESSHVKATTETDSIFSCIRIDIVSSTTFFLSFASAFDRRVPTKPSPLTFRA